MNRYLPDPFGSMQGFLNQYSGFMQNPMQMLLQRRINVPQNMMNNPSAIIQHMMDNGMLTQQQYGMARNIAGQAQSNPMFQQFVNRRR